MKSGRKFRTMRILAEHRYKLIDAQLRGALYLRRSLQRIVGKNVTLIGHYLTDEGFTAFVQLKEKNKIKWNW